MLKLLLLKNFISLLIIFAIGTELTSTFSSQTPWGYFGAFTYIRAYQNQTSRAAFAREHRSVLDPDRVIYSVSASCSKGRQRIEQDGGVDAIKARMRMETSIRYNEIFNKRMAGFDRSFIVWPYLYGFIFLMSLVSVIYTIKVGRQNRMAAAQAHGSFQQRLERGRQLSGSSNSNKRDS